MDDATDHSSSEFVNDDTTTTAETTTGEALPDLDTEADTVTLLEDDTVLPTAFSEMPLSPRVVQTLAAAGFHKPTPIQALFIPQAMTGRDVMGQAKTGTGKTGAFLIPIFEKIKPGEGQVQALILAPTRELALQIHGELNRLGSQLGYTSITLYGGASYEPQIEALSQGVDIVVGTPGRIMDHMRSHRLDLSATKIVVLDEADRMLDLGFRKDIEYIMRQCPPSAEPEHGRPGRQTMLLSATIADDIKKLSRRFMHEPLEVWTAPENLTVDTVEQHFFVCEHTEKMPILLKLLEQETPELAIIFTATKIGAKKLAARLKRLYINAREIHGDLQQAKREKIMNRFRTGEVKLLIATDVASRGIDVTNITHIINYDVPFKTEDYVHRVGRTGRMERSGKAFTFVTREEGSYLTEIELLINKEIKRVHYEDLTSRWWPNPPTEPPADFDNYEAETYIQPGGEGGGGGGDKGKRKRRRGKGKSEGGRSDAPKQPALDAGGAVSATEGATSDGQTVPTEGAQSDQIATAENGEKSESGEGRSSRKRRRPRRKPASEPMMITCSACGVQAEVRFKPDPERPVYCETCYQTRKGSGRSGGRSGEGASDSSAAPVGDQEQVKDGVDAGVPPSAAIEASAANSGPPAPATGSPEASAGDAQQ